MKSRLPIAFLVLLSCFAAWRPLSAHHSSAAYDMEHPVNMKGVVTNMEWGNPHVFIYLDVKDDSGNVEQWRVEGNSPNMLVRSGWKKEMIKTGDQLQVNGAPAKNGSKVIRLITLTLANGQKYDGQGFK
jgi:DNA/RNA endonuclease YhcR with UshA esterase domain